MPFINSFKKIFKKRVYLDYAAMTPIDPRVMRVMNKYSVNKYGNPSAWYKEGVFAKNELDKSRKSIANFLHAHQDEIVFTSGGTEANNLAMMGVVEKIANKKGYKKIHIIVSSIEHSSIIECARECERRGAKVDYLSVDKDGVISLEELKEKINENTVFISIMTVNNEIGSIEPIRDIAKVVRQARERISKSDIYPILHTDASQAPLYLNLNVEQLGVDLLTLDAMKTYGPRGVGLLYIKRKISEYISPIIFGGGQEGGIRSGTENLPLVAGFAKSLELAEKYKEKERVRIDTLKRHFIDGLLKINKNIIINGDPNKTASHILNVSIPNINNEFFVLQLDAKGFACSTKSACLRDEHESYVLKAVGTDSNTSIRFSFGRWTKRGDIRILLSTIQVILSKMDWR